MIKKRVLSMFLIGSLLISGSSIETYANPIEYNEGVRIEDIIDYEFFKADLVREYIVIDGETLTLNNHMQDGVNGYVIFPIREVCEAMGYQVDWNQEERSVLIYKEYERYKVYVGINEYPVEGGYVKLIEAPQLFGDNCYVPIDFIDNILGRTSILKGLTLHFVVPK